MRDDLLDAYAAVDWAETRIPVFGAQLDSWCFENREITVEEAPPPVTHNGIVVGPKAPLPLWFNVEAGVYIHLMRTALDLMATALAYRHSVALPEKAYFPIAPSEDLWRTAKGSKFIKALPPRACQIIEDLKPYKGGNDLLWALHELDNVRKHRRMLSVRVDPESFTIEGPQRLGDIVKPLAWVIRADNKTEVLRLAKTAKNCKVDATLHITIEETGVLDRKPVVTALREFLGLTRSILDLFDR
jgi:hypothetical protein